MTSKQKQISFYGGPFDGSTVIWCPTSAPPEGTICTLDTEAPHVKAVYRFTNGVWRYVKSFREHVA